MVPKKHKTNYILKEAWHLIKNFQLNIPASYSVDLGFKSRPESRIS